MESLVKGRDPLDKTDMTASGLPRDLYSSTILDTFLLHCIQVSSVEWF